MDKSTNKALNVNCQAISDYFRLNIKYLNNIQYVNNVSNVKD